MKEQDLIALGLTRVDVSEEESGEDAFYYYTKDFGNGTISLISPAHNEVVDDRWSVEIFEDETIRFTSKKDLKSFIDIVTRASYGKEK